MCFDAAFLALIEVEKGYLMGPRDPGNWTRGKVNKGFLKGTKYGISAASYPSGCWGPHRLGEAPPATRFDVFDGVVNSGPGSRKHGKDGAIRWLQRAAGVPDDGVVGPATIQAVRDSHPDTVLRKIAKNLKGQR